MYLSELKIKGYKVFDSEFKINLKKGLTVLIGENGCGKTAIIDSIRLLLNEDEFGRLGISDSHFHRPINVSIGAESIQVSCSFSNLDEDQQIAFLPWLDASDSSKAYLNKKIDNTPNNRWRFDHKTWGGESMAGIFEWELINSISCIYLPPLRDAQSKLEAYRGSRLSRLFKSKKPKKGDPKHNIEVKFEDFNNELLEDPTILGVNNAIKKYLKESLGSVMGQDAILQFAEVSFDRIVEKLRLLFYPRIEKGTKAENFRDITENSLGYNNILYLATVLAELDGLENEKTQQKILLIEEPEAHLHPQLQIKLLQYLNDQTKINDIQIIVTTHSPTVTSSCGLNSLNVITNIDGNNPNSTLLENCDMNKESQFFLERWLDITKSTLFFSKGILFVEGIAEALVIKELAKKIISNNFNGNLSDPKSLEDFGVSVINLNGVYFKHFMQLFQGYKVLPDGTFTKTNFIPIKCAGITDCDPRPVKKTQPTPSKPCECGNTQSSLFAEELIKNNSQYCRIFSNLKTFEYDLAIEENNLKTLYSVLYENYKIQTKEAIEIKQKSEKNWSLESIERRAEEGLTLLSKIESKGDFSQKLAYKLNQDPNLDFTVPKYIENAVKWVTNLDSKTS